jgi:hypothetical protein
MIVALALPLFASDFSDSPQVLVTGVTLCFAVGAAPNPGSFARGDRCSRLMAIERVITFPLIVGAIRTDLLDLARNILQ